MDSKYFFQKCLPSWKVHVICRSQPSDKILTCFRIIWLNKVISEVSALTTKNKNFCENLTNLTNRSRGWMKHARKLNKTKCESLLSGEIILFTKKIVLPNEASWIQLDTLHIFTKSRNEKFIMFVVYLLHI